MPTPTTYTTNSMPVFEGTVPGLNANGYISNIAYLHRVVNKTSDYTVKLTESGTIFTTRSATAAINFTLPAVASTSGHTYYFFNCADQNMTITSAEGDNIIMKNDVDLDSISFQTTSEKIGGAAMLVGDGTSWLAFILSEELVTVTTAD